MPANRLSEDNFDRMLGRALRSSSEPVPADFTERMLERLRESEQRRILARIVLQERLALAGCIVLVAAAVTAVLVFPDTAAELLQRAVGGFKAQGGAFVDRIPQTIEAFCGQWQFYSILAIVFGFAVYSLVGLFVGDRLRVA